MVSSTSDPLRNKGSLGKDSFEGRDSSNKSKDSSTRYDIAAEDIVIVIAFIRIRWISIAPFR